MDRRTFLAAGALASTTLPALAQDAAWPTRPIRMVVDFPPGGSLDVITRLVSQKLSERVGQPVVVENRAGAGGNIGALVVATAAPDGYTLLSTPPGPLTINQSLYKEMPFDPTRLTPVILMATMPNVITARNDFPASTARELIAYVKAHPRQVTFGSQGNGSTSHLTAQMFATMIGGEMVHVPFRGEGPALVELMAGRLDLFFGNTASVMKYHEARQVKLLGLSWPRRSPLMPDIPAATEYGMPDFVAAAWFAMAAPPGTPASIVDRVNSAVADVIKMPEVRERFVALGCEPVGGTPAEMASMLTAERARWKKVIDTAHVKLD